MSVLNPELYAIQNGTNVKYSYPFNNSNYPQYKQNYITGLLDNSIWLFELPNNFYGYGNYCSTLYFDNTARTDIKTKVEKNRYNKNLFRFAEGTYIGDSIYNGNGQVNSRWYPYALSPACNARFWLNYDYGNTVLYPYFNVINPETGETAFGLDYNTASGDTYNGWLVQMINIDAYVGAPGEQGNRTFYKWGIVNQYAGLAPGFSGGNIEIFREDYSGTWYWCKNRTLFDTGVDWYTIRKSDGYTTFNNVFCPYDTEGFFRTAQREDDTYIHVYKGINIIDAGHMVTALGHYWAKTLNSAINSAVGSHCTDDNIVGAKIDKNNRVIFSDPDSDTYSGLQIADIANNDPESNFNWGAGAANFLGKTLDKIQENTNPDNSEETEETELNENTYSTAGAFNAVYAINETNINYLAQWLWNGSPNLEWNTLLQGLSLMGENPINAVISIKMFPLDINYVASTGSYENIYVGKENSGISARPINRTTIILDMGDMRYDVGDNLAFLNYEPYSSCNLYIPYCGILSLSPTEVIGKTISVKMIVDLITGACTGIVFIDNIAYAYKDGIMSIDVPITGANMSQYFSNLISSVTSGAIGGGMAAAPAIMAMRGAGVAWSTAAPVGLGLAITGAGIGATVGTIAGQAKGVTISKLGTSSPACSLAQPQYCYLIIETPKEIDWLSNYGHTNGFLSYRTGSVASLSGTGFSIFENVDCSGITGATENEKEEIKRFMESGVFL